jgi:hypothetical protein
MLAGKGYAKKDLENLPSSVTVNPPQDKLNSPRHEI